MPADNVTLTSSSVKRPFRRLFGRSLSLPLHAGDIGLANRGFRAGLAGMFVLNILNADTVLSWHLYLVLAAIPLAMTAIIGWDPIQYLLGYWRTQAREADDVAESSFSGIWVSPEYAERMRQQYGEARNSAYRQSSSDPRAA